MADNVSKVLVVLWVTALAVFLLRLILLRVQELFPLFLISNGLDMVFIVPLRLMGVESRTELNIALVALAMGVTLTPFVAFELYRVKKPDDHLSLRFLAPVVLTVIAGCVATGYLATSPDGQSLAETYEAVSFFETVVTFGVLGFLVGKLRRDTGPVDRNLKWMRRLFVFEAATSGIHDIVSLILTTDFMRIADDVYVGASFIVIAVCAGALRKEAEASAA